MVSSTWKENTPPGLSASTNAESESNRKLREELAETQQKLQTCNKLLAKSDKMLRRTKANLHSVLRRKTHESGVKLKSSIQKFLNEDQVDAMVRGTTKGSKWSDSTITKSLRLKFSSGSSGYTELRKQGYPAPGERTLRRNIEDVQLKEGIFDEMFELMKQKIATFTDDRMVDCELAFDEITHERGQQYDPATKSLVGKSSFKNNKGEYEDALHSLTFMLAGIEARWKLIVAHYYTPASMKGEELKPIIDEIIRKAEEIGLRVHLVASDMGPVNQALWNAYGVCIVRRNSSTVVNSIEHPQDKKRRLWFSADGGHLLKNIKNCLLNNKTIAVTPNFMASYNLPSSVVKVAHIEELSTIQENQEFKLARKLKPKMLDTDNPFGKMKVCSAKQFLSRDVSAALNLVATVEEDKEEWRVSATFLEVVSKWFAHVTSRHRGMALGKTRGNEFSEKKFDETVAFLEEVIELFRNMKVGAKFEFKPVQRGVVITTTSYIELTKYLIQEKGYTYVLGGRLTTDGVENVYSLARIKHEKPTALQFKQSLRVIAISQYMKPVKTSSYEEDDREMFSPSLTEFKKAFARRPQEQVDLPPIPDLSHIAIVYGEYEFYALYHIAGYIMYKISENNVCCKFCIASAGSKTYYPHKYAKLTELKRYNDNKETLFFVNDETYDFFFEMDIVLKRYLPYFQTELAGKQYDLMSFFYEKLNAIECSLKKCKGHEIRSRVIKRFIQLKLSNANYVKPMPKKVHSSKTLAKHAAVN